MKTLFKLFIVAAFSIISLSSIAQNESVIKGQGTIGLVNNNGIMIITDDINGTIYGIEKLNGAFKFLKPGDIVTFEINVLPNGLIILKELKVID